jgi:N-acetyl-anhydromuramyl-L-alanine amidase AmpD
MVKRIQQINPADRVSWHILIGENGTIYQSVRLVNGAWHVRKSAPGTPAELVGGVNRWLIGVELESRDGRNFAPALVDAARELIGALHEWRPDWPAAAYTYGHHQFDPARRSDPGPEWLALLPSLLPAR